MLAVSFLAVEASSGFAGFKGKNPQASRQAKPTSRHFHRQPALSTSSPAYSLRLHAAYLCYHVSLQLLYAYDTLFVDAFDVLLVPPKSKQTNRPFFFFFCRLALYDVIKVGWFRRRQVFCLDRTFTNTTGQPVFVLQVETRTCFLQPTTHLAR